MPDRDAHDDGATSGAPPCAPELLQELLRQLDKTVRLHQLYPATNPTYLKTLDALRAAFRAVWTETDEITLQVSETQFMCGNTVVMDEPEKASDSLPWTMFKDGVRQLSLARGFEDDEVDVLLDIIPKVRRAQDWEEDVLTLMWAQDFEHLSYRFVDTVSSEGAPLDPSATPGRWPAATTVYSDPREAVAEARRSAQSESTGGLEGALRAVVPAPDEDSARERADAMRHLREGITREYDSDLREDVTDVLLDIFELQRDASVRAEVLRHLDALLLLHVSARSFGALVRLLRESSIAAGRAGGLSAEQRTSLLELGARLSDPALLGPLLGWIDDAEPRPSGTAMTDLLEGLGPSALGTLFEWAAESKHHDLRLQYGGRADLLAAAEPAELVKLVNAEHEAVALEAMHRCGAQRLEAAVVALVRQLGHAAEHRRAAALSTLATIGTSRALAGVERALSDASVTLRTSALKILAAGAHRAVLPRVAEWVTGRETRDMEGNERRALFELYGTLCGDVGVPWLASQLVGPKGFFKRKSDPETRACAAAALGRVNTSASREVLRTAHDEDDPLVRQAVRAALSRGSGA